MRGPKRQFIDSDVPQAALRDRASLSAIVAELLPLPDGPRNRTVDNATRLLCRAKVARGDGTRREVLNVDKSPETPRIKRRCKRDHLRIVRELEGRSENNFRATLPPIRSSVPL